MQGVGMKMENGIHIKIDFFEKSPKLYPYFSILLTILCTV